MSTATDATAYELAVERVGDALTARLLALLGAGWPADDVVVAAADLIVAANVAAADVAAVVYAAEAMQATGQLAIPAVGADPHAVDSVRLRAAMGTVLQGPEEQHQTSAERLARGETSQAAARAYARALADDHRITGWRRNVNSNACQLCRWWARDGKVWDRDHRMPRHTGCTCSQQPVTITL